jgi:hypothetical protein
MKNYIYLILLCFSCSSIKKNIEPQKDHCNENLKFKIEFFKNIENIENQMTKEKDDTFDISLKFISKYTHVSFESMANYANNYPIGVFEKDKEGWIKWYDKNKCNDIQFK